MNDERTSGAQCVEDESEDRGRCDCAQLPASMRPCVQCTWLGNLMWAKTRVVYASEQAQLALERLVYVTLAAAESYKDWPYLPYDEGTSCDITNAALALRQAREHESAAKAHLEAMGRPK